MSEIRRQFGLHAFLWAVLIAVVLVLLFHSFHRYYNKDEFEGMQSAWKILHGERIYVDFFQHHHPFFYYALVPVIAVCGETTTTIAVVRLLMFVAMLLILYVTYRLSCDIFGKETGVIALLFLTTAPFFAQSAIEIRPDVPQTLFGLLSLSFLFRYLEDRSIKRLTISAVFLAVSFLFLQKAVLLLMCVGGLLVFNRVKMRIPRYHVLLYGAAFAATLLPYFLYLLFSHALSDYFFHNWTFNVIWLNARKTVEIHYNLPRITFLWSFYILGLLFFVKETRQRQFAAVSLGLLLSVFTMINHLPQYFLMSLPLISAVAAHGLYRVFRIHERQALSAVAVLLAIFLPGITLVKSSTASNSEQIQRIAYVLSITAPGDYVYDGFNDFNVFRKDLDFFWFTLSSALDTYMRLRGYRYDVYELIDAKKPKVITNVVTSRKAPPPYCLEWSRLGGNYVRSEEYRELFIRLP